MLVLQEGQASVHCICTLLDKGGPLWWQLGVQVGDKDAVDPGKSWTKPCEPVHRLINCGHQGQETWQDLHRSVCAKDKLETSLEVFNFLLEDPLNMFLTDTFFKDDLVHAGVFNHMPIGCCGFLDPEFQFMPWRATLPRDSLRETFTNRLGGYDVQSLDWWSIGAHTMSQLRNLLERLVGLQVACQDFPLWEEREERVAGLACHAGVNMFTRAIGGSLFSLMWRLQIMQTHFLPW